MDAAIASLLDASRKRKRDGSISEWLNTSSLSARPKLDDLSMRESGHPSPRKGSTASPLSTRHANSSERSLARLPPLTLATSELVALHTPTTLHTAVFPPELACKLFYYMIGDAETWPRNTWYLSDKLVTSPHRTAFFVRSPQESEGCSQQMATFWYNGKAVHRPKRFPPLLEEACRHIEPIVIAEMRSRSRYPLEWAGPTAWEATVAAANCYEGMKEGVGYHADALTCSALDSLCDYLLDATMFCRPWPSMHHCKRFSRLRATISPTRDDITRSQARAPHFRYTITP